MAQIGIIGGGTWGIALASLVHENGHQVTVWSAFEKDAKYLRENRVQKNLPIPVIMGEHMCMPENHKVSICQVKRQIRPVVYQIKQFPTDRHRQKRMQIRSPLPLVAISPHRIHRNPTFLELPVNSLTVKISSMD